MLSKTVLIQLTYIVRTKHFFQIHLIIKLKQVYLRIGYSSCDGVYIYRNLFITLLFSLKQCYNETRYEEVMVYMQPFSI